MGMFDTLLVADALPYTEEMIALGLNVNNRDWQTKDLDNLLETYILQGGKLFLRKHKNEQWIEGTGKGWDIGHMEYTDPYLEPVSHHGKVYFYDYTTSVQDKWDCWVEFVAVFTNGECTGIELVKFEKTDNSERLKREDEWKKALEKEQNLWYNKYFRHTRPYNWFSRRVWYRGCIVLSEFFNKLAYKL